MPGLAPFEESRATVEDVCNVLNSKSVPRLKTLGIPADPPTELTNHLRELIGRWLDSGQNLEKISWDVSFLHEEQLRPALPLGMYPAFSTPPPALTFAMRTAWHPTAGPRALLILLPDYAELEKKLGEPVWQRGLDGTETLVPKVAALVPFCLLTITPGCEKIAGPCPRCDRYYIKKRASQKVYCTRTCGNAVTAVLRTSERRAEEREDKLKRAAAAIEAWSRTATRQDWKRWVAKKTSIDLRFLTYAVNKHKLIPPKQEK